SRCLQTRNKTAPDQLSFKAGDIITLKRDPSSKGWGLGELKGKVIKMRCSTCN
ncbi:unnamed protein product, partial [Phaeothamnion confervicola]